MPKMIALLRGINVGGKNKIKMAELRSVLEDAGLTNVDTYIQSGNIIFDSKSASKQKLEVQIGAQIEEHFGWTVPAVLAIILTIGVMVIFAWMVQKFLFRHLVGQPHIILFMATIGLAYFLEGVGDLMWGSSIKRLEQACRKVVHWPLRI